MVNKSYLPIDIWQKEFFTNLEFEEKYLMLYLLTNPYQNKYGCYHINPKDISKHTGIHTKRVNELLTKLMKYDLILFSLRHKLIAVKRYKYYEKFKSDFELINDLPFREGDVDRFINLTFCSNNKISESKYNDFIKMNRLKRIAEKDQDLWRVIRGNILVRDNYTCQYCGKRGGKLEIDHIIPFSQGGTEEYDNLITSCKQCNRKKHTKSVLEFMGRANGTN